MKRTNLKKFLLLFGLLLQINLHVCWFRNDPYTPMVSQVVNTLTREMYKQTKEEGGWKE